MKFVISALLAAALLAFAPMPSADAAKSKHQVSHAQKKKGYHPLRGVIYGGRRPGGYSYHYAESIDTRRFVDPSMGAQSQSGPFDSGFFFETPRSPFGGTTPYMH